MTRAFNYKRFFIGCSKPGVKACVHFYRGYDGAIFVQEGNLREAVRWVVLFSSARVNIY